MTGFSAKVRQLIIEREGGCCAICSQRFSDMQCHHRRPRGMGGSKRLDTNTASAGLWLCGYCHRTVESHRLLALDNGWLVRQSHTPAAVPVLRRETWVLLDEEGGYELVKDAVTQEKTAVDLIKWESPATARTAPGDGRHTHYRESTK